MMMSSPSAWERISGWAPALRLFSEYQRGWLPGDLMAALVVALVVIPSSIAYADLANCPPVTGLYAAGTGMIAYALFTSSRHVIAGPDAAVAILVGATVGPLSRSDPAQAVVLSTWLALLAAVILLLAGWLRLGGVAEFLSSPVMLGFMNGAAVVIIGSQIGKLSGISLKEETTLLRFLEWVSRLGETHPLTVTCGLAGIAILVGLRWWRPRLPGTIVIFLLALIAGRLFDFASLNVQVIGAVATSIPSPIPPELFLADVGQLITGALGLALLIFPEGILLSRAMAERHRYEIKPDQELLALGMANLTAGLCRSFAVGASQTRTLLNSGTGGQTQLVSFVAALLLVTFMYFLASWVALLPIVAIAAILVFTGITLVDVGAIRQLQGRDSRSGMVAWLTSFAVIAFGVLPGIMLGIVLSLLLLLRAVSRPQDALLGRVPGSLALHDVGDDEAVQTIPGLVVYRFYGPLIFANIRFFIERVEYFIAREQEPVHQVIVDARAIPDIDVTAAEQLQTFMERLHKRGIRLVVAKAHLPLREAATRLPFQGTSSDSHYARLSDAVAEFEQQQEAQG